MVTGYLTEINGQIVEIVPVVYKNIWETNSNVIFTEADDVYELAIHNGNPQIKKRDTKIGCINLDINSNSYGMNIIPPIMDRICDFDLDYKGFAYAVIGAHEGYLSKEVDTDRYNEFISLYAMLKQGNINSKFYFSKMNEALSKILFTKEETENKSASAQTQNAQKNLKIDKIPKI